MLIDIPNGRQDPQEQKTGFKTVRQLNASLNIYLKMFPHIRSTPRVWVGVIPLKGRMKGALPPWLWWIPRA